MKADAPSWGRALASAGCVIYAGRHWDVPCTTGLLSFKISKKDCFMSGGLVQQAYQVLKTTKRLLRE